MKYADQPDRFMDSETDLDEAVKALLVVVSARWACHARCGGDECVCGRHVRRMLGMAHAAAGGAAVPGACCGAACCV